MSLGRRIVLPAVVMVLILSLLLIGGPVRAAEVGSGAAVSFGETTYATLAEAVSAVESGDVLQLNRDITETLTVSKNVTLDLNGYSIDGTVTVAEGYTLTVKDSTTDDFTSVEGYGKITTTGDVRAADGYIAIEEEDGTSYHRLDLRITSVNLRPGTVGIYYGGNFGGDEAVKAQVEYYGTALSLTGAPTAQEIKADKHYSRHTAFSGDSWVCGETGKAYGTLLKGIWKDENYQQKNAENAKIKIYGASYVQLTDGTIILGNSVCMSLQDVVEKVDVSWNTLDGQQIAAMKELYEEDESIVEKWNVPNLKKNVTYQVTFVDYDDTVIEIQLVDYGCAAKEPKKPTREKYIFDGWDADFTKVEGRMRVKAQYIEQYTVTFVDYDGTVLKQELVKNGSGATAYKFATSEKPPEGYNRTGWDKAFDKITEDTTVRATYKKKVYTVKFYMPDGSLIDTKEVEHGAIVEEPTYSEQYFDWSTYRMGSFSGWDRELAESPITSDTSIRAQYKNDFNQPVISIDTTSKSASIKLYAPEGCYLYAIDFGFNWFGNIAISNCVKNSASVLYKGKDSGVNFDYNNKYNRFHYTWTDGAGVAVTGEYATIANISFETDGGDVVNKNVLKLFKDCMIVFGTEAKANIDDLQTITPIIVVK